MQPHAAHVTCNVWDVETNIDATKLFSCSCDWAGGSLYRNSQTFLICLQIRVGIGTVLMGDTVVIGEVNKLV